MRIAVCEAGEGGVSEAASGASDRKVAHLILNHNWEGEKITDAVIGSSASSEVRVYTYMSWRNDFPCSRKTSQSSEDSER